MAYWWVNQAQTWKHEIAGGYMWSPKRNQNGARNQFYENMRRAQAGDIVFAYYQQHIQQLGIVQCPAISKNKPLDFGAVGEYWGDEGWFLAVEWRALSAPFRSKAFIEELRPLLPDKYSPLQRDTGDGLQGVYFAAVPEGMAEVLLRHAGGDADRIVRLARGQDDNDEAIRRLEEQLEQSIRNNTEIDETERQALVQSRRGQGRFRKNLMEIETKCRVSGVTDHRFLRASHIKPWRSCESNHERLDGYNGFLLAPHIDHLFDRGYISFDDDGMLLLSSRVDLDQFARLGIPVERSVNVGTFSPEQRLYLAYHRANVYLG